MAEKRDTLDLTSEGEDVTRRLGRELGRLMARGDVVLLEGDFGAGKTVFSQGVAQGLGVDEYVTSPSFTLINEYPARKGPRLYHIDLYRLESPAEVLDLGLLDYVGGDGVCLVEWAERVRDFLPPDYLRLALRVVGDTERELRFEAYGERHRELLAAFAHMVAQT